jgi:hypothetical protein
LLYSTIKDLKNRESTYKGNNAGGREAGHHRHHREEKTAIVWPLQKDVKGKKTKINYGKDTRGEKKNRTSKKNVDGRSTSSHDSKKFRKRSMEKQGGMAFWFPEDDSCYKTGKIDR